MNIDPSTQKIDFKNRRALVTGAGKGIGREIAVMLQGFNAQVVAVSRTQSRCEARPDAKPLSRTLETSMTLAEWPNKQEISISW
jgi:NAD(P)-dependent dehydrogenase (short-subunit alcohol dehydrogenase family)